MDKVVLLRALKEFTEEAEKNLLMPTKRQAEHDIEGMRSAEVYTMRLPDSGSAKKKAPYILHQIVTGRDAQETGKRMDASTQVRTIFCVYCPDEQEGGLMLLNMMERLRIALLKKVVIGNQFALDTTAGVETLVYYEDTAPYYAGEMATTWKLPTVEREECLWLRSER